MKARGRIPSVNDYLMVNHHGRLWTKVEVALLGRVPDDEVARRTGRSVNAVRQKREALAKGTRTSSN